MDRKPSPVVWRDGNGNGGGRLAGDVYHVADGICSPLISADGRNDYMRIHMKDGNSYQKPITLRQAAWYNGMKPDEKEDVTLTIAATMFTEEILLAYLAQQPIHDFKNNIKSVSAVKKKDGGYAQRITMNDGMPIPLKPMDTKDETHYRRLSSDDRQDFLPNLAVNYLTREDARAIIQRIRQVTKDQTDIRVLLHPQDLSQSNANAFALNFAKVLSCFNVSTERRDNREWEVSNRSRYDDLDTKQSGSQCKIIVTILEHHMDSHSFG